MWMNRFIQPLQTSDSPALSRRFAPLVGVPAARSRGRRRLPTRPPASIHINHNNPGYCSDERSSGSPEVLPGDGAEVAASTFYPFCGFDRYKYQDAPIPWVREGAVDANKTSLTTWPKCNNNSNSDLLTMINNTPPLRKGLLYTNEPISFRVSRKSVLSRPRNFKGGEEVLELQGSFNWTQPLVFNVYLNLPSATNDSSLQACREYLGCFIAHPHVGSSPDIPGRMTYQVGVGQKLLDLGLENLAQVTITIAQHVFSSVAALTMISAKIFLTNI